jgi:hypothetical protein
MVSPYELRVGTLMLAVLSLPFSISIAQPVLQRPTGWAAGIRFPARARGIYLLHSGQTGSGAHPILSNGYRRALPLGVKWPGREADHSPPSSTEVKNGGAIPPLPHVFMAWRLNN